MKPRTLLLSLAILALSPSARSEETRTVDVKFAPGTNYAEITDRVSGHETVLYRLNAREGQFLSVSLRPDNQAAEYNIYVPGKGLGDSVLFDSDLGGREYTGQLYLTGNHTVAVFLNRAAARRNEVAKYDLVLRITDEAPARKMLADDPGGNAPSDPPPLAEPNHGVLLERQAAIAPALAKDPVSIAMLVLEPDLGGITTSVATDYDSMENPSQVEITVTEGGFLDDDLLGYRHVISMARNRNNEWRITGYQRSDLRRR